MANKHIRQAFQAALDMEPIMSAGIGNKAFYRLDGALFFRAGGVAFAGGRDGYNQKNKAKAHSS